MTGLRSILGAFGPGVSWAVGWGIAGILAGVATEVLPVAHALQSMIDPWMALATPGLILGLPPFVLGTPTDAFPLWALAVVIVGSTTLLCTVSACGTLTLARRVAPAASRGG